MTAVRVHTDGAVGLHGCEQAPNHAEIIEGVLRGQSRANAALYDTLRPVVVRSLERVLRQGTTDEDLVQTCFERIVATLIRKQGQVNKLTAWAGAISANVAVDALRSRIRERKLFEAEFSAEPDSGGQVQAAASPEHQVEARHRLLRLQRILGRMKPIQAEVVLLHDVFGHDLDEVAELTGVTPSAAQRRLSRARHELLRRASNGHDGRATK